MVGLYVLESIRLDGDSRTEAQNQTEHFVQPFPPKYGQMNMIMLYEVDPCG